MGWDYNKNAEWKLLHSAYGVTIKGKLGVYNSCYDNTSRRIIVEISVNDRELYLGNNFILRDKEKDKINFENDMDYLCWMFAHRETEMDDYDFEKFFLKEYHSGIWRERTRDQMLRAQREEEERKAWAIIEEKRQKFLDECKAYAEKKKLYMVTKYDDVYFIKLDKRNKEVAERLDPETRSERILEFAQKYPGNGVDIVEGRKVSV